MLQCTCPDCGGSGLIVGKGLDHDRFCARCRGTGTTAFCRIWVPVAFALLFAAAAALIGLSLRR